jgi:hypothetical protein
MNALEPLFARLVEAVSLPVPLLLAKVTLALAVAWLVHAALARQNPRWRVLVWRLTALGCALLAGLAACPPLVHWAVLPDVATRGATAVAEISPGPATEEIRRPTAAPAPLVRAEQGRGAVQEPVTTETAEPDAAVALSPPTEGSRLAAPNPAPHVDGRPAERGWGEWAMLVWYGGLFVLSMRTALGAARVRSICRGAKPVEDEIVDRAFRIARDLGISWAARATADGRRDACPAIRQSTDVLTPCLVGLWRPTILLPAPPHEALDCDELTAVLAHELAHVRGRDLLWNAVLHALAHVLWFHPLAWRVRTSHAAACDVVCDAVAANYLGDTAAYTRTLARLAVRVASPATPITTASLAMARTSDLRHRIQLLQQRRIVVRSLPHARTIPLAMVSVVALTLLGGTEATPVQADPPPEAETVTDSGHSDRSNGGQNSDSATGTAIRHTIIHAVGKEDGQPLEGVRVRFHALIGGERVSARAQTDQDGLAPVDWTTPEGIQSLSMTAEKEGLVPVHYSWAQIRSSFERSEPDPLQPPASLELEFERGHLIGGMVQDEAEMPVAGASISIILPSTWSEQGVSAFLAAQLVTDGKGKWEWPHAPQNLNGSNTLVHHPEYLRGRGPLEPGLANVVTLERGLQVAGRVTDAEGRPIAGANVTVRQHDHAPNRAQTGEDGRFVLYRCEPGPATIWIQVNGFAVFAHNFNVTPESQDEPLGLQLQPGHVLRIRVVDEEGRPVSRARILANVGSDAHSHSFETGAAGLAGWGNAPPGPIFCDVVKDGYVPVRRLPLETSSEVQTVTLTRVPELLIEGTVTDAVTGEPIPYFEIARGDRISSGRISWPDDRAASYRGGAYTFRIAHIAEGFVLRVTTPGYRPAESRLFQRNEGRETFHFKLQPGRGPAGLVLLPGGAPAVGAEIALATRERKAAPMNGFFDRRQNRAPTMTADIAG